MTYTIEKGHEIPSKDSKKISPLGVIPGEMEPGDSVLVTDSDRKYIYNKMAFAKKRTGNMYVSRSVENGYRVWRIE